MTRTLIVTDDETLERRRATRWLHPIELVRTSFHALFSTLVAGYTDRRETLAALQRAVRLEVEDCPIQPGDADGIDGIVPTDERGVWIDFIADVGDGFDATYGMATVLARQQLSVAGLPEMKLERADIVVLGGDLVYPTPSREQYRTRLRRPLEVAFPENGRLHRVPSIFAIPGNHDWYDGLTNFIREFCTGGRLACWQLWQKRSYFAVKLPGRWWLWGVDIQFDTRVDPPQLDYFERIGARFADADESQRVILCTAKPSWYGAQRKDESYRNLEFFEGMTIRKHGARSDVIIAGDVHHYARFSETVRAEEDESSEPPRQRITAGGGGSYLRGTHNLPEVLELVENDYTQNRAGPRTHTFVESGFTYPSRAESSRLLLGTLKLPFLGVNLEFCALLGIVYALVWRVIGRAAPDNFPAILRSALPTDAWTAPSYLLLIGLIAMGGLFAATANRTARRLLVWPWGLTHAAIHILAALSIGLLVWSIVQELGPESPWHAFMVALGIVAVGGLVGGFLFGLYLVLSDRWFGWHENEAFLAQNIPDFRSFVRMHVAEDGSLTIYPIGVRRIPRRWRRKLHEERSDTDPGILEPVDGSSVEAHLIEGPIVLPP